MGVMEWVAIDIDIAGDPAVHRMAEALRIRVPEVVGLLTLTFGGMAKHSPDGSIAAVPDTLLETWATWHGKRGRFSALFRAELCDAQGVVRAWEKYNGRNIRRAKAASERTRVWREKSERERTPSANGTHNVAHNVCRTGQDRTGHNKKESTTAPRKGAVLIPPEATDVVAHYRTTHPRKHPDQKGVAAVVKALGTYSIADCMLAIEGNAKDEWAKRTANQGLTYVFRNNETTDKYIALGVAIAPPMYDHATGELTDYGERMSRP